MALFVRILQTVVGDSLAERTQAELREAERIMFANCRSVVPIMMHGTERYLPTLPKELEAAPSEERELWKARQIANRYVTDVKAFGETIPESIETVQELFAWGFVELERKTDGSLRQVSEQLGFTWNRGIKLFEQTVEVVRIARLAEMRREDHINVV